MVVPLHVVFSFALIVCALTPSDESKNDSKPWWAVQPIAAHKPPEVKNLAWARNDIDRFILASLEKAQLQPAKQADKRTLLRRVTINLTGLMPTPQELASFENDTSSDAYEKVINRLLASPRFGERMARNWIDLVHYAESHGHDEDKLRPHAWPYRDYLIRSFNDDKPYARFVQEQVAGDVLFENDADGIIALGMLSAGPWDQSSQMGIMDGTLDKQIARYLDRDDMISTVMSTFTSTTVHCARCHDHKFDPISTNDYYALQAVFAGVDRTNRPYDKDKAVARQRSELTKTLREAERTDKNDPRWSTEQAQQIEARWEARQPRWTILSPLSTTSSSGATLIVNKDLSISSQGKRPDIDTVTISAETGLKQIRAVRLELLTDSTLPHQGPGRHENGNLHLTEIKLSIIHPGQSADSHAKWKRAISDYDQPGWGVAQAIDGNQKTAWGIFPKVGQPHVAFFELASPITIPARGQVKIALEQNHGAGHLIGRFRLSLSEGHPTEQLASIDQELNEALLTPTDTRSVSQKRLLSRLAEIDRLKEQVKLLPAPEMVYAVASYFPAEGNFKPPEGPRSVDVLRRGDVKQPMRTAKPGTLSCVSTLPSLFDLKTPKDEGERRAALARWLTHRDNPLTWRSMANRLWQWHFGQGLVNTPNDFGKMGSTPSHPELLDWLANQLREGTSIKTLHKMMVCSATYQQASNTSPDAHLKDVENKLLSHMPRTRLDAETTRDSILQLTDKLDLTMFGPSIKHFNEKPGLHVTPLADYDRFNLDTPGAYRRSIYRFMFRTVPDPLLDSLDCPDGAQLTPQRNTSTTPLQALTLLHHPFMVKMSEHLAERLRKESSQLDGQITQAFNLVLLRPPSPQEKNKFANYAQTHGLANLCRILLNTNEFHFVD